jgi:hypothetical protein
MCARELNPSQWPAFFDAFNRQCHGHAATLELPEPHTLGTIEAIARDLPLVGITAEPRPGGIGVRSIEIVLGAAPDDHVVHTVNLPTRVLVDQDEHGADQVIVIRAERDPTVRLDLRDRAPSRRSKPAATSVAAAQT